MADCQSAAGYQPAPQVVVLAGLGNREGASVANAYFRSAHPFIGWAR
jgi:hypothetical protein